MGFFSKSEFTQGFTLLGIDSLEKLKSHMPKLNRSLTHAPSFKELYTFVFNWAKQPDRKNLEIEVH